MDVCVCLPLCACVFFFFLTSCKGDTGDVWPWVGQVTTVKADLLKGQEHQSRTWPHILHSVRPVKNPALSISDGGRGGPHLTFLVQVFFSVPLSPCHHVLSMSSTPPCPSLSAVLSLSAYFQMSVHVGWIWISFSPAHLECKAVCMHVLSIRPCAVSISINSHMIVNVGTV